MIFHLVYANSYTIGAHQHLLVGVPGVDTIFIDFSEANNQHHDMFSQLPGTLQYKRINDQWWDSIKSINPQEEHKIFIHYLDYSKAKLALRISEILETRLFWIYYGADLHTPLRLLGKRETLDKATKKLLPSEGILHFIKRWVFRFRFITVKKLIAELDGFCHWDSNELVLCKKHFATSAQFIYFRYFGGTVNQEGKNEFHFVPQENLRIVINHSGSLSGNHLTILKRLSKLDVESRIQEIILPLSYGDKSYIDSVKRFAKKTIKSKLSFWQERVSKEEYLNRLAKITVAIFGHRREEGAGNINLLLSCGVKVFLRRDNNHLKYLSDKGYHVFCFEDIRSLEDFTPLSVEQKENNRRLHLQEFRIEEKERVFMALKSV